LLSKNLLIIIKSLMYTGEYKVVLIILIGPRALESILYATSKQEREKN